MEWSSLALWADSFMSSFTPRISADVRLLIGHVLLTFSGWLNCALALFVGASVFVAGNKWLIHAVPLILRECDSYFIEIIR